MSMRTTTYRPVRDDHAVLSEMNITPLIDVLLVLLVMMILTIPSLTHEVPVDIAQGTIDPTRDVTTHQVDLAVNGALAWDGVAVTDAALPARLAAFMAEDNAQLHIRADAAARYERFDQVLATIKRAGVTRLGFVGNERFRNFSAAPS